MRISKIAPNNVPTDSTASTKWSYLDHEIPQIALGQEVEVDPTRVSLVH